LRPLGGDFGNGPRAMISTPGVKTPGGGGSPKVERAGGKPGGKLKWQAGNGDSTAGVPKGAIAVEERKAAIRRRSLSVAHAGVPRRFEAQQEKDLLRGAEGDRPGKAECHAQARRAGRFRSQKLCRTLRCIPEPGSSRRGIAERVPFHPCGTWRWTGLVEKAP
jgi:hypothetical protein